MSRQGLLRTVAVLSSLGVLAGCGSGGTDNAAAGDSGAASAEPTGAQPTLPGGAPTTTAAPTPSTVDAPCPYLDTETVKDTVGQHLTRTTVTATTPHPSCAFYRPDGHRAAAITVSAEANPIAAQNAALAKVGKNANPVNGIGDYGVVAIVPDGAVLAVTKGPALVLVTINQQSSLEAKEIARAVVAKL